MKENHFTYIVIGAGLSGLTSAHAMFKKGEEDFIVLESRSRLGGRILSDNGIDFGATWFQNHHRNVMEILEELHIERFYQYSAGKSVLVYNTMAPEHYFESDPNAPSAHRIAGNSAAIIHALAERFPEKISTGTTVTAIEEIANGLQVTTDQGSFTAEKVILTVPPRIAARISFSPELPAPVTQAMEKTHTWMSNAMKVGITFKTPFWRDKNLSGTVIGQVGAVTELYDHCDSDHKKFALMGFINEGLRDFSKDERKKRILDHLAKYLGEAVRDYLFYDEKDWSKDRNTSCETIKSVYLSPSYGNPLFERAYLGDRLMFSGAETSPVHGGYMDGAVFSGLKAAERVMGR